MDKHRRVDFGYRRYVEFVKERSSKNYFLSLGTVASNTSNRMIIIVISVIAGLLLIVLIVVLVKLKRQKRPQELSTPVDIPLEITETSPESHLPTDQVKYRIINERNEICLV